MLIHGYDLEPLGGRRFWVGRRAGDPAQGEGPTVIVKLAPDDPLSVARLLEEQRLLKDVPQAIGLSVINFGFDESVGAWYYVLLSPQPIGTCAISDIPPESLVPKAAQLARGLAMLHSVGIAYRGFRPAPILLSAGMPLLFDFSRAERMGVDLPPGLVRAMSNDALLLAEDRAPGDFDPPEAAMGPHDGRKADVYSLGVFLRHMGLDTVEQRRLIQDLTASEPLARPTLETAIERLTSSE